MVDERNPQDPGDEVVELPAGPPVVIERAIGEALLRELGERGSGQAESHEHQADE